MSSNDALIALVCLTVAVAVVAQVWRSLRREARRRARKLHYLRAGYESRPQQLEEMAGSRYDAVGPERAQAIRRQAELAALSRRTPAARRRRTPIRVARPNSCCGSPPTTSP